MAKLVHWVAEERKFIDTHWHGVELKSTVEIEGKIGVGGIGDEANGGEWSFANLGASLSQNCAVEYGMRVERVPESEAMFVERKCTYSQSMTAFAGNLRGAEARGSAPWSSATRRRSVRTACSGARAERTVKLTLDGKLAGAYGIGVAGKFGVGVEATMEMQLRDLLAFNKDAITILMGDDDEKAIEILKAFPIKLKTQAASRPAWSSESA